MRQETNCSFCFWKLYRVAALYKDGYIKVLQPQFGKLSQIRMFISFLILKIFAREKENAWHVSPPLPNQSFSANIRNL